ncbi:MAG: threonine synthase [Fidelibacterota bacterium]
MTRLMCRECGTATPASDPISRCRCGGLLTLESDAHLSLDRLTERQPSLWRYREAIPIEHDEHIVSFGEGYTPIVSGSLNGKPVLLKLEYLSPSGSFKDRGSTVLVSKLVEWSVEALVEDSSGNGGVSLATYGARAGLRCTVYVPEWSPSAKVLQMERVGARVVKIAGSRHDVEQAAREACESGDPTGNPFYAGHNWSPYFLEGTKTFAYEVAEQLDWKVPDVILFPVGNGSLLLGSYTGFGDLMNLGIVGRMPKLVGIQPEHCGPIVEAFEKGVDHADPVAAAPTVAKGTSIPDPPRGRWILEAVRRSGGMMMSVSENEIVEAMNTLHRGGYFIEPTSAVAVAGLKKYVAGFTEESILVPLTGRALS